MIITAEKFSFLWQGIVLLEDKTIYQTKSILIYGKIEKSLWAYVEKLYGLRQLCKIYCSKTCLKHPKTFSKDGLSE